MRQPFDREKAMNGQTVVTRHGTPAKFIAYVPEAVPNQQLVFLVHGIVVSYADNGQFMPGIEESKLDLFMSEQPKTTIWINLFVGGGVTSHNSEEEADRFAEVFKDTRKGSRAFALEITP